METLTFIFVSKEYRPIHNITVHSWPHQSVEGADSIILLLGGVG